MKVYEEVKKALQDIVAPQLKTLEGEIKRVDNHIDNLERTFDTRIDSLEKELKTAIHIRERLAAVEAKIGI